MKVSKTARQSFAEWFLFVKNGIQDYAEKIAVQERTALP